MQNFKELIAWQRAMDLAELVYALSRRFPKDETYGLRSQIRRAVVSIPSNIAEGQGRGSSKEYIQFLQIAYGSLQEVETQLLLAERFEYLAQSEIVPAQPLIVENRRLLNGLINSLRR